MLFNNKMIQMWHCAGQILYLTVILRTLVEYELIADEAPSAESAVAHIRRE